jgi:hypothetical protein
MPLDWIKALLFAMRLNWSFDGFYHRRGFTSLRNIHRQKLACFRVASDFEHLTFWRGVWSPSLHFIHLLCAWILRQKDTTKFRVCQDVPYAEKVFYYI